MQHGSCRLCHCHGILYAFRNFKTLQTGTTCHRTTLRLLCHRTSPSEVQTVSFGKPPHRRYKLFLLGSLSTAQPSACFAIVPPHGPFKLFLLGFETAAGFAIAMAYYMLSAISKPSKPAPLAIAQPSACFAIVPPHRRYKLFLLGNLPIGGTNCFFWEAAAPHNPPLALPSYLPIGPSNCFYWASKPLALPLYLPIGPTNCFYWASKLLHGTFWPGLKTLKSPAAAFESLSTAQPSACFAIVPPHRPYKLFLLGFDTATWHVLARP